MFEGVGESLTEKWESFLSWSDDKGLPLRQYSDALEEKGIPPAPLFAALAILIVAVAGFAAFSAIQPATATVTVSVSDFSGLPIQSANVYIEGVGTDAKNSGQTGANGQVTFDSVAFGNYKVTVNQPAYNSETKDLAVSQESAAGGAAISFQMLDKESGNCTLSVSVTGADTAILSVRDSVGNTIDTKTGRSASFSLPKNAAYAVQAEQPGYTANSTRVTIGSEESAQVSLSLSQLGNADAVELSISVSLDNNSPAAGATIAIRQPTGIVFRTVTADGDGKQKVTLNKGDKFVFATSLDGYIENVTEYAPKAGETLKIRLYKTDPATANKISCRVTADSVSVSDALVREYSGTKKLRETRTGRDGRATLDADGADTYRITAYKVGYLPGAANAAAGSDCSIALEPATKDNSGKVRVTVVGETDEIISGASVALFGDDGALGLPEAYSGSDGIALFSGVPAAGAYAYAYANGREGTSDSAQVAAEAGSTQNGTALQVRLLPATGKVKVTVMDHFSRKPVTGAVAQMTTVETASCATRLGKCEMTITEGWGTLKVTADGYAEYSSAQTQVKPNADNEITAEMVSTEIASLSKPVFLGLFDLSGNKVSSLEPSTTYNARFLLNGITSNFSSALLHVRLGDYSTDAAGLDAYISGYDGGEDAAVASGQAYAEDADANESASRSFGTAYEYAQGNELKWAEFSYKRFSGTKEIVVQVTTRQVLDGSVSLAFRTAYKTTQGTLRAPADDTAGSSVPEQKAAVNATKPYKIAFGGKCSDSLCLEARVESALGKASSNFEAQVPEEFTLIVKGISPEKPYELRVTSNTFKTAQIISGTAQSAVARISNETEGQRASIAMAAGNAEARFSVKALRPAEDLAFAIEAVQNGTVANEIDISGRVISAANNKLKVAAKPSSINALEENSVQFSVTDEFGTAVENAQITVGSEEDAFGQEQYFADGTGEKDAGLDGKYVVAGINPPAIGYASYSAKAAGFSVATGKIPVGATQMVAVSPAEGLAVAVETKDGNSESVSVRNALENNVTVTASIAFDKAPKIIYTALSQSQFTLEAKEAKSITFDASISQAVLEAAKQSRTLADNATGNIIIEAVAGKSKQTVKVPFAIMAAYKQNSLDDSWEVDGQSGDLTLVLGSANESNTTIRVRNKMGQNLLINYQLDSKHDWFYYYPASLVLGPYSEGAAIAYAGTEESVAPDSEKDITITARLPDKYRRQMCIMDDEGAVNTTLTLVASVGGVTSKKSVPVTLATESETNCAPDNGVDVSFPLKFRADLPAGTAKKQNSDGSIAIRLSDNSRVLFASSAQLSKGSAAMRVTLPKQALMSVAPAMATITKPNEEFSLRFPFATAYMVDEYVSRDKNADGSTTFTLKSGDQVTFPSGTTFVQPTGATEFESPGSDTFFAIAAIANFAGTDGGASEARVPAYGQVQFKISADGSAAACRIDVKFGQDSQFFLPSGTQQESNAETGVSEALLGDCQKVDVTTSDGTVIRLPEANRFTFSTKSEISRTTKGFTVRVPTAESMGVAVCSGKAGEDTYEMTFNQPITFVFPKNTIASEYKAKFASCEQVMVATSYATSSMPNALSMEFGGSVQKITDGNGNTAVNVPAQTTITVYACPCETGNAGGIHITLGQTIQGINGFGGTAMNSSNSSLRFNLTDEQPQQTMEVCLTNNAGQTLNVTGTAGAPGTGYDDLRNLGFIKDADMFFYKESTHSSMLPSAKGGECSPFAVTAKLPPEMLDSTGCIKKEYKSKDYRGLITFKTRLTTGQEVSAASLPKVEAFVAVRAGKCEGRDREDAANGINDVFVNYDSQITSARTGNAMVLAFKDIGHQRPIAIVNNREQDVQISYKGSTGAVECTGVPSTLSAGAFAIATCTSTAGSAKGAPDQLTFGFKASGEYNRTITVNAVAYEAQGADAKALAKSTPIGDMLPLKALAGATANMNAAAQSASGAESISFAGATNATTVANATNATTVAPAETGTGAAGQYGVSSFLDCSTHFCTYDQAKEAYTSFVQSLGGIINYIAKDDAGLEGRLNAVCTNFRGHAYTKTIVMQMANTQQDLSFLNALAKENGFESVTNNAGAPEFKGCGIYPVVVKLNICNAQATSADDFRKSAAIDISVREPVACEETLANAPLLIGNDLEVVMGNEQTQNGFTELFSQLKNLPTNISNVQRVRLGVYKDAPNAHDFAEAQSAVDILYGSELNNSAGRVRYSNAYNAGWYCMGKGALALTGALGLVGADALAIFTGFGTAQAGTALLQGLSGCVGSSFVRTQGEDVTGCAIVCECPNNVLAAQANFIFPGAGTLSKAEIMSNIGLEIASTAVGTGMQWWGTGGQSVVTGTKVVAAVGTGPYNALFNDRQHLIRSLRQKGFSLSSAEKLANDVLTPGKITQRLLGATTRTGALKLTAEIGDDLARYAATKPGQVVDIMKDDGFVASIADPARKQNAQEFISEVRRTNAGTEILVSEADAAAGRFIPVRTALLSDAEEAISDALKANGKTTISINEMRAYAKGKEVAGTIKGNALVAYADEVERKIAALTSAASGSTPLSAADLARLNLPDQVTQFATKSDAASKLTEMARKATVGDMLKDQMYGVWADNILKDKNALSNLERRTGGAITAASTPSQVSDALRELEATQSLDAFLEEASIIKKGASSTQIIESISAEAKKIQGESAWKQIAPKTEKVTEIVKKGNRANGLRIAGGTAVMLGVLMGTDCDYRPVQALANPETLNRIIVYSNKAGEPSTVRTCFGKDAITGQPGENIEADPATCLDTGEICQDNRSNCIGFAQTSLASGNGLTGYSLFLGSDDNQAPENSARIYGAMFDSSKPPITAADAKNTYRQTAQPGKGAFKFING